MALLPNEYVQWQPRDWRQTLAALAADPETIEVARQARRLIERIEPASLEGRHEE